MTNNISSHNQSATRHLPPPRILTIAGSDSGGGAGIQGDIKTISALGGYAASAITAITAQNTLGVSAIHPVPPEFVAAQIRAVLSDIGADAIKTGMLLSAAIIDAVADALAEYPAIPLILDPVMVATSGADLLLPDAVSALKTRLFPRARLITPNIPEAERLSGIAIRIPDDMRETAHALQAYGVQAVLIKGGHLPGETIHNILRDGENVYAFSLPRIASPHTHGTGCVLASAIATALAGGKSLIQSIEIAQNFVSEAIQSAPSLGAGHGPLGLHKIHPAFA